MREMNIEDITRRNKNREQIKFIHTQLSRKKRSEDEMVMLMKSARNRFKKSVDDGRIEIISKHEWTLR